MQEADLKREAQERVGQVLRGKWRLEHVLGVGGMACVYAATHRNGMRGALKILHRDVVREEAARQRFLREGYVANRVPKGAVKVLDDDSTEDGTPFLVMELLEGSTVDALATSRPGEKLELAEVVGIGQNLLEILDGAHGAGIVHRDIKPENLFLTHAGDLRILDFGIARLREQSSAMRATSTQSVMGTPAFMPPEQALARWDEVGPHSDIYSVGATMFTLLSGQLTHLARTAPELLVAVATQRARPLRSLEPGVPVALAEVIDRALSIEPQRRWSSARTMKEALELAARLSAVDRNLGLGEGSTVELDTKPVPSSLPRPIASGSGTLASAPSPSDVSPRGREAAIEVIERTHLHHGPMSQATSMSSPISPSGPGGGLPFSHGSDAARAMSKTTSPVSSDPATRPAKKSPVMAVGVALGVLCSAAGIAAWVSVHRGSTSGGQIGSHGTTTLDPGPSPSALAPTASAEPPRPIVATSDPEPRAAATASGSSTSTPGPAPSSSPPPKTAGPKPSSSSRPKAGTDKSGGHEIDYSRSD